MSTQFDSPRNVPDRIVSMWRSEGLWTDESVSDVIRCYDDDPRRVACVVDDTSFTFDDLRRWSVDVARQLTEFGVTRGDRILIQLPNCAELVVAVLAGWHLGAVVVPVVPLFRERELASVVRQTQPAAIISTAVFKSRCPTAEFDSVESALGSKAPVRLCVSGSTHGWSTFPPMPCVSAADPVEHRGFRDAHACALVLFTSGTTAEPKGVRHDSLSLIAEARSYLRAGGLTGDDVVFNPAPIAHIGAIVATVLLPWVLGVRAVVLSTWDSDHAAEVIAAERVTFAVGAPVFLADLVSRYERPHFASHRVSVFQTGAAPTSAALMRRAEAVGVTAWRAWGMTESPTMSYGCVGDAVELRISTDGCVEPGSDVVAVDEFHAPIPAGVEGELRLRSPKQMLGYIDEPRSADTEGWVYTGDLGIVDSDGWVRITGRIKDIINRGGEKFSALDVENVLSEHPAIESVAAVGVPDERLGEQVAAYVSLRAGMGFPGAEALLNYLRAARIASQKFPVTVDVTQDFPRTATGKIRKRELVERWISEHT